MGNKSDGRNLSRAFLKRQEEEKIRQEIEQEKGEARRQRKIGHGARVGLGVTIIGVLIATPIVLSAMAGEESKPESTVTEATEIVSDDSNRIKATIKGNIHSDSSLFGGKTLEDAQQAGFLRVDIDSIDTGWYRLSEKDEELQNNPPTDWMDAQRRGIIPQGDYSTGCYIFPYSDNYVIVLIDGYMRCMGIHRGLETEAEVDDLAEAQRQGLIPEGDYSKGYYIFPKGDGQCTVVINGHVRDVSRPSEDVLVEETGERPVEEREREKAAPLRKQRKREPTK